MKFESITGPVQRSLQADESDLEECFTDEVRTCTDLAFDVLFDKLEDAGLAETCAAFEEYIESTTNCVSPCDKFSCEENAEQFIKDNLGREYQELCGGIDFQATCEDGNFTSNGEASRIPVACLLDEEIFQCINSTEFAISDAYEESYEFDTQVDCNLVAETHVAQFNCLKQCETFQCSASFGDLYDFTESELEKKGCDKVDLEASCERGEVVFVDPIQACVDAIEDPNSDDCELKAQAIVEEYICLSKGENFTCASLGDDFAATEETFESSGCERVDFEASCELGKVVSSAADLTVGASIMIATVATVIRMLK